MKTKQQLIGATAACNTCGSGTSARNALAWAHNHVRHNPEHSVHLAVEYTVRCAAEPKETT
jgi:hypothetical protein